MSILVLEHSDRSRCGRLASTLRDHGHRLDIRRLHTGDPVPSDLEGIDGVITTGGPMAPTDERQPWMAAELDCLAAAAKADLPMLGICLGCQLLARALGGTVERRPSGPRLGWHDITLTPEGREDQLLAGLPWTWTTVHWNTWQVATLPEDSTLIATGQNQGVQAWRYGVRVYALQFHPEVDPATIETWIDDEPAEVAQAGTTKSAMMSRTQAEWSNFQRLSDRLFKACAMLLFPLEQRTIGTGMVREIHH